MSEKTAASATAIASCLAYSICSISMVRKYCALFTAFLAHPACSHAGSALAAAERIAFVDSACARAVGVV